MVDVVFGARKVDVRLPGKGNSKSHGARPAHLIITMIKWIRTSRLSIKISLSGIPATRRGSVRSAARILRFERVPPPPPEARSRASGRYLVEGLGFGVEGLGFRVQGLGFGV